MTPVAAPFHRSPSRRRGSLLISTLILTAVIGVGLGGYIRLSANSLRLAQRASYLNDVANLAEAGLEEAAFCFRRMEAGTPVNTAWSGWTVAGSNASITLPPFNRNLNAIGIVKVFVTGYNGSVQIPEVYSQATISPLDGGPPVTKTLKLGMKKKGAYNAAIVGASGVQLGARTLVNSFNSNPTGAAGATPLAYPGTGAGAKATLIVLGGSVSLGNQSLVNGDVAIATGVSAPPASQVSGEIITDYNGHFPLPAFPSVGSVTRGYALFGIPATLPRAGDQPASDGRYYYFALLSPLGATTITAGKNVTIVPSKVTSGLTIEAGASCTIFTLGTVTTSGDAGIVNRNWAGALQIFTWTIGTCDLGHNGPIHACIYAPLAEVRATGGGANPTWVGAIMARTVRTSANLAFHYDEALRTASGVVGIGWTASTWYDLQGETGDTNLEALTDGFMQ